MNRFRNWKPPLFDEDGWAYPNNILYLTLPKKDYHKISNGFGWRCQYPKGLKLGTNVDVGCFTYMNAHHGIELGDNVQIGAHCAIYSHDSENNTKGKVIIGENCLIGSYTLILPNVVIPPNTKIRARSVLYMKDGELYEKAVI